MVTEWLGNVLMFSIQTLRNGEVDYKITLAIKQNCLNVYLPCDKVVGQS